MGFEDFFKKAGNFIGEVKERTDKYLKEVEELKEKLQYDSDSKLKDLMRNGNSKEKIAARQLLEERGYSVS